MFISISMNEIVLGSIFLGFFIFLFLLPGNFSEKMFLALPALGPAALIYWLVPVYKMLFAFLWVIGFVIIFFILLLLALRQLT